MATFRLLSNEYPVPETRTELTAFIDTVASSHGAFAETGLVAVFSSDLGGRTDWAAAMMANPGGRALGHLAFAALNRPDIASRGWLEARLSQEQVGMVLAPFGAAEPEGAETAVLESLRRAYADRRAVTVTVLLQSAGPADDGTEYLRRRTTLLFDLFNAGALRGTDAAARQALLDSFTTLPNRFLTEAGQFIVPLQEDPIFLRRVRSFEEWSGPIAEISPGGIDKFPSLLSVRANELLLDGNRIVPSAMIRDGVHVGKRNIFMFHAAVNIGAFIGDDNLIDSHASIASSAQIGNKNKIGSFVSIEGVLSPANAAPVTIGDENFLGTFVRLGTGIKLGARNFIGAGVNLSLGTKLKDCRAASPSKGDYVAVRDINDSFHDLAITPNNAVRDFEGVALVPGEYVLFDNSPDFMSRFEGDARLKPKS